MKYIYNPVTGTIDDIETPTLSEKYFDSAKTDEIKDIMNKNFAEGGQIRQNFNVAGLIGKYAISPAVVNTLGAVGITAASVAKLAEENPTALNKIMAYIGSIPGKLEESDENTKIKLRNLFKNEDVDIDSEKQKIIERIEKVESDKKDPDQEPPEEDPDGKLIRETVLETVKRYQQSKEISDAVKKIKKSDLQKDFKKEAWKEKPIVSGSYAKGTRKVSTPKENISFFEDLNSFANEKHGGVLKDAVKDITGLDKNSKEFKNIYVKIQNAAKTRDFKFDLQGLNLPQDLLIKGKKNNFKDLTTILKTNPEILKDRLKPFIDNGTLNRNKVYNKFQLAEIFGVDITSGTKEQNTRQGSNFMEILEKNGARYKDLPGGKKGFALYEAENAIFDYSRFKQIRDGSGNKSESNIIRQLDDPGFETFRTNFYRDFDKNLSNLTLPDGNRLVLPESTAQVGHNPIPVAYKKTLNMFKDKKLTDKVFNLGNLTFQTAEINRGALMETQGKLLNNLKIIDRYYGKDVSKNNIGPLTEARDGLIEYFKVANATAKEKAKEFGFVDKNVIGELTFKVPKIGEKLTEKFLNVDMSNVGKQHIVGYVDQVNNKAVKFNDLSNKQKKEYAQNFLDQKISQLRSFFKDAKYDPELIEDIVDALLVGTMPSNTDYTQGVLEKEIFKIKKASGGVIPDQEIVNYANGGRINYEDGSPRGPNEPEGDDFLNKLEFQFNNIDDVEIDDTPITFDDSKSKIAQVADLANPKNIPYYADMAVRAGLRIGEFGARIIPATGELVADLIQKPLFKTPSSYERTENYANMVDDTEVPSETQQGAKFVGGPIFKNFLKNITPTSTEKLVGLDTLINEEKKKMIERGSSSLPVKVAETAALGGELIAPIFPGLKLLKAFASAKGVKPTKDVAKTMDKEIDQMAAAKGMTRREFLTATGAVGTIALAKLLGISSELPKIAKTAEAVTSVAKTADGVPQYLYDLKNVIRLRGELQPSSSAFLDGQEVYTYKGVTLYHNTYPKDGSFRIAKEFETDSIVPGESSYNKVEMEVNKGGDVVVDEGLETQKVVKGADEYEEATAYPAREGGEDVDFYVEDDFHKQLEEISKELEEIDSNVEMFGYDK